MKWTWDPSVGAIYLHLIEGELDLCTLDLAEGDPAAEILLDIDRGSGEVAGIEILIPDGGATFVRLKSLLQEDPEILGG